MFHLRPTVAHHVHDRLEHGIVEQHTVFRVIDDIFQLVLEQARIDGV